jgi:Flp pilus assembly protein TadB
MALIECTECKTMISDKAESCPKCGAPRRGTVTTQQTGKRFKAAQLVGVLMICIGMVWLIVGAQAETPAVGAPVVLFILGFIVYLVARFRAWWSHG